MLCDVYGHLLSFDGHDFFWKHDIFNPWSKPDTMLKAHVSFRVTLTSSTWFSSFGCITKFCNCPSLFVLA